MQQTYQYTIFENTLATLVNELLLRSSFEHLDPGLHN